MKSYVLTIKFPMLSYVWTSPLVIPNKMILPSGDHWYKKKRTLYVQLILEYALQRIYETGKLVSDKTYDYCSMIFDWTLCCGQNTLTTTWASCCPLSSFPQILFPSTEPTITQPTNSVTHELTINHTPSIWQMNLEFMESSLK